jgi:hypothetical protein
LDIYTRREAKAEVIDYIEMFCNSYRLHSSGYVPPVKFERLWGLKKTLAEKTNQSFGKTSIYKKRLFLSTKFGSNDTDKANTEKQHG